jgi:hypothetical protein
MATVAQSLTQSILGVFRDVKGVTIPGSMELAPMVEVPSAKGFFQTLLSPTLPDARQPLATGVNAQHPNGSFLLDEVAYSIGEPELAPYFAITDRQASALVSANGSLDILGTFSRATKRYLHANHLTRTLAVAAASSLTSAGSIDLSVRSTNLLNIFQTAGRGIELGRGEDAQPNVLVIPLRVAQALDQFDQVAPFRGFAATNGSTQTTYTAGSNPVGAFGLWMEANGLGRVVIDRTAILQASDGAAAWAISGTSVTAYYARAEGGSAPSAFKTLYVPFDEAAAEQSATEAFTGEGMFRFSVRRAAPPAQPGYVATGDSQFAPILFDASLARTISFTNVPAV